MAFNRYDIIWRRIKERQGRPVQVKCRAGKVETIVLAVKKIKSAENRARIGLELGRYPEMSIKRVFGEGKEAWSFVSFMLPANELAERL